MRIALQMYTLRDECDIDFIKTLEKVSSLGYEGVEFAGFYDISASVLKEKLDELNLLALSSHTGIDLLENELDKVIKYNKIIGNKQIVCPFSNWENDEEFLVIVSVLNHAMEVLKANGMTLLYHNHSHEFEMVDHQYKLDLLLEAVEGMKLELDTCWVSHGKVDVVNYMENNKNKIDLVHIKDIEYNDDNYILKELGGGCLPIAKIINKSKEIGLDWLIVENDLPKPDGMTNITNSMEFLRRIL